MVAGTSSPEALANLAQGRLCRNQPELAQALSGQVRDDDRLLMQSHLEHLEFLEQQRVQFDQRLEQLIEAQSPPAQPASTHLVTPQPCSWQQAMSLFAPIPAVAPVACRIAFSRGRRGDESVSACGAPVLRGRGLSGQS